MNTLMMKKRFLPVSLIVLVLIATAFGLNDRFFQIERSLSTFSSLYKEVNAFYVDEVNPNTLMQTGIDAMLATLDPYTNYISEDRIEDFRTLNTGQYGGIGATTIRIGGKTYISMIFEGFPAQNSNLQIGDEVLAINRNSIYNKSRDEISQLMKGQSDTDVILTVKRYGGEEPFNVQVGRERITIENVPFYGILDDNKGYLKLSEFTQNASKNVKEAVIELKKQGAEGIILDLRSNPGGLLIEAVNLSNIFLPKGSPVVSTKGKIEENNTEYKARFEPVDTKIPLIILVNSGSASASEIVAGVMQDYDRAILIGHKSYGKGLVQTTRRLSYNAQLKITTAKYYIPSGRCIQALDYSNRRPDGSVGNVPDSLITAYNTRNGRSVYGGGGIDPDIEIEIKKRSPIAISLVSQGLIFQYGTLYRYDHEEIADPVDFEMSTNEYESFAAWLKEQNFSYETAAEKELNQFQLFSKEEGNWDKLKNAYEKLVKEIAVQKQNDVYRFKNDIVSLLEEEIVSRYWLERGAIEASFDEDPFIQKSIEILDNQDIYARVLEF